MLHLFLDTIRENTDALNVIADPDAENHASISILRKIERRQWPF
ncbi:MAG: hypothetical protein R2769_14355 [Saprospiraceae bacterium]